MPRRRSTTEAFSLFAFQDIITSVTGVIILITLILALELMDRVENSPAEQTEVVVELLDESVEELTAQKSELQAQLNNVTFDSSDLPTTDAASLKKIKSNLMQQVESLTSDISKIESKSTLQAATLAKLQSSPAIKVNESKMKRASAETLIAEQKLKELKDNDRMFFRSGTTGKTIWLVEVTDNGFLVAKLGVKAKPTRYTTTRRFRSWWKSLSSSGDALYVLTKPSGVESEIFDTAREELIAGDIAFGYGVIQESVEIIDPQEGAGSK